MQKERGQRGRRRRNLDTSELGRAILKRRGEGSRGVDERRGGIECTFSKKEGKSCQFVKLRGRQHGYAH